MYEIHMPLILLGKLRLDREGLSSKEDVKKQFQRGILNLKMGLELLKNQPEGTFEHSLYIGAKDSLPQLQNFVTSQLWFCWVLLPPLDLKLNPFKIGNNKIFARSWNSFNLKFNFGKETYLPHFSWIKLSKFNLWNVYEIMQFEYVLQYSWKWHKVECNLYFKFKIYVALRISNI